MVLTKAFAYIFFTLHSCVTYPQKCHILCYLDNLYQLCYNKVLSDWKVCLLNTDIH